MLGLLDLETSRRDFHQYYVSPVETEDVHLISMQIGDLDDVRTGVEMRETVYFMLDSGFSAANTFDLLDLDLILAQAEEQGVKPDLLS